MTYEHIVIPAQAGIQEDKVVTGFPTRVKNDIDEEMNEYYVYIMASKRNGTLYIGVTNDIVKRVYQHKNDEVEGFTAKYRVHHLVWYESCRDVREAIAREKQLKKWNRKWKLALIEKSNPQWQDLYDEVTGSLDSASSAE